MTVKVQRTNKLGVMVTTQGNAVPQVQWTKPPLTPVPHNAPSAPIKNKGF